jgi:hypothetical protein
MPEITMLPCGCVYSTKTLVNSVGECWYCKQIRENRCSKTCFDYRVKRGFIYNDETNTVTARQLNDSKRPKRFT